ncbi:MAG TPA: hypothetical protein VFU43_00225 [Streptosporangiaceae bacterium]|nr:hypothetical protein [Streptosporangiaceae bacterium]
MSTEQEPPESGPAWAPRDPNAGDPPPGGLSPMGPGGRPPGEHDDDGTDAPGEPAAPGEQAAGGYAAPAAGGYGSPAGGYGPASGGYGSQPGAYGSQPGGYGSQPGGYDPSSGYGGYGGYGGGYGGTPPSAYGSPQAPHQDPYGSAARQPYGGTPQQPPYGTGSQQPPYGSAAQQPPYGTGPQQPPYGAGPGAGPESGWMPSYPPPPPAPKSNNKPLIIGGVAVGVVVLLALVAGVIGMTGGDKQDDKTSPPTVAASNTGAASASRAAQSLGAVPALRYSGTFSSGGDELQAQLTVTKGGSATGTITVGGDRADLVSVDGNTFLKAPRAFWRDQGGVTTNPEDFAGRWAKASESAINLDIKNVLAAGAIVRGLQGVSSYQPAGGTENVNGTPAIKVSGADAEYYISTANPPKLLRIAGTGTDAYRFDVSEVSTAEVTALFQQLRDKVRTLTGARDPSVRFLPTTRIKASNCGVASCTMKLTVTTFSVGTRSQFRAIMLGKITAGGRTGRTLGTCTDSATASSGKRVSLSCTVRGGAWSSWVRGVRGSASYYVQARTVAESRDTANLLSIVDREQQGA